MPWEINHDCWPSMVPSTRWAARNAPPVGSILGFCWLKKRSLLWCRYTMIYRQLGIQGNTGLVSYEDYQDYHESQADLWFPSCPIFIHIDWLYSHINSPYAQRKCRVPLAPPWSMEHPEWSTPKYWMITLTIWCTHVHPPKELTSIYIYIFYNTYYTHIIHILHTYYTHIIHIIYTYYAHMMIRA